MASLSVLGRIGVKAACKSRSILPKRRGLARPLCFSVLLTCTITSKLLHLYAHSGSINLSKLIIWGPTFFSQDIFVILSSRWLLRESRSSGLQLVTVAIATLTSLIALFMASVNVFFYISTGAEIHWRHSTTFPKDEAGVRTLLYGASGCLSVSVGILCIAYILASCAYRWLGYVTDLLTLSLSYPSYFEGRWQMCSKKAFNSKDCFADTAEWDSSKFPLPNQLTQRHKKRSIRGLKERLIMLAGLSYLLLLQFLRPNESAYEYLSCTLFLSPLSNLGSDRSTSVSGIVGAGSISDYCKTSLRSSTVDWSRVLNIQGFEKWYGKSSEADIFRYLNAARGCLYSSNLKNDVLEPIRSAIHGNGVKVKHVVLLKLESTRKDLFPLTKESFMWNRIAESYEGRSIPHDVLQALDELSKTSSFLTGDHAEVESQNHTKAMRGGITASNAFTTSTYTLKSVVGTLCGITPLVADFNEEYLSHFYQPCLAHIFEVFNQQSATTNRSDDFRSWPWKSYWMQSVTNLFDNQASLTPLLGYQNIISRETLIHPEAPHFPPKSKDINYFGLPETELRPYLYDAIKDAEQNRERLFITHLTSTTHHPWGLPDDFELQNYVNFKGYGLGRKLNRYLNTIAYADKWVGEILSILEDTGIANETLFVLAGDHGISLPTDGSNTPYENPHVGTFHVPLVFSHPALPPIRVDAPVTTMQVLPTILDLLISSSSLNEAATQVASDLLPMYEGQSLIRPPVNVVNDTKPLWQFTVMNTGGSWLSVRSANESFRLVVPLVTELEWRFTDLSNDPQELKHVLRYEWLDLLESVESRHGRKAADWVINATQASDWWVPQNRQLWQWEGHKA